jgi:[ribosomal protein S18]-alanine N-acetyltransferase
MTVQMRRMAEADLPAVLAIQEFSQEAPQWSAADWRVFFVSQSAHSDETLKTGSHAWSAWSEGTFAGYLAVLFSGEEVEILSVAVAMDKRRKGIATKLLDHALTVARNSGARRAWLEVRASNTAAGAFYEGNGFQMSRRRPNYYSRPQEDALVLSRVIIAAS